MKSSVPFLLLALTTSLLQAAPPELRDAGRKLSNEYKDSVVWLSVLAKTSMSVDGDAPAQLKTALAAQDKEMKTETTGTIIDASGLIVASLNNLDMSSAVNGQTANTPMGPIKIKATSEIKELNVITADGSEIPADLVLKDEDLGLAFIKIRSESEEAKGFTFKPIDLTQSAKGDVLDDCVVLGRLDETLNREASVDSAEISGVTTSPRTFYRINTDKFGSPVFLQDGKLLGITVVRKPKGGDGENKRMTPVVLPAADVAKIVAQAKEAKPVAAKKEEAKEESKEEKSEEKSEEK